MRQQLTEYVQNLFSSNWTTRNGQVVPVETDIGLGNDAVQLDAAVLYADLADSTVLVDGWRAWFAADMYKAFLHSAAKIIRDSGGAITAYDGDRVMAVFIGDKKEIRAVRAGMKINYAVKEIIRPAKVAKWPDDHYVLKHVVGIDASPLFVARTGIRGANDLVWVGRAANHAAKLAASPDDYQTYITPAVFNQLDISLTNVNGAAVWQQWRSESLNYSVYRSTWHFSFT
ncbi:adenylate/guanylate cyclase domain-containing protein [Caballeronia novacaledonica]|uniref:Adenylate/guanylate cyclase domain-containing protein n=2 Tax=Caballeronia novacaledonica TaxID=1544861 RepID=A0AA37I9J6_9BURK|nr:adenylate/guanylate cyclase domain-containing protein [Caballeronia novacaledonica]GJH18117.1 adenylate/guanylate cyclase domain-containing protein [Caballeronia novacaledonica]GJH25866.1 adenylate/guanylate cyclase domain-containing protein [Caballeronia novacaledonica]